MDANRVGKVTAAEMTAAHQAVTGQLAAKSDMPAADKIKVVDSDGGGVISAGEHAKGGGFHVCEDGCEWGWLFKQR